MDIRILHLIEGAKEAKGLTVIIDVFRAFSTACYVFGNGAERIIPVGDFEMACDLKKQNPTFFLIGERGGKRPPEFDYGNSPTEIEHIDFTGRTVIQTTSAGTQGIANAWQAEEIITGSFCNVGAIIAYIQSKHPKQISLVCMGHAALEPVDEDTLCAQFIKDSLGGKTPDFQQIHTHLRNYRSAHKFFDPKLSWAPKRDFDLCLDLARFDFVLKVQPGENGLQSLCKYYYY
jgi:2-phosphosulfolactate phosphatase